MTIAHVQTFRTNTDVIYGPMLGNFRMCCSVLKPSETYTPRNRIEDIVCISYYHEIVDIIVMLSSTIILTSSILHGSLIFECSEHTFCNRCTWAAEWVSKQNRNQNKTIQITYKNVSMTASFNSKCCCNETPPMTERTLALLTRTTFGKSAKLFTRKLCDAICPRNLTQSCVLSMHLF